jgi:hypothetical protein
MPAYGSAAGIISVSLLSVCGYRNARAANLSTFKHHIGILNGSRRGIRAGMPSCWTSKMRSHCFRFRTRVLISSPTHTVQMYDFVLLYYLLFNSMSQFKVTDMIRYKRTNRISLKHNTNGGVYSLVYKHCHDVTVMGWR